MQLHRRSRRNHKMTSTKLRISGDNFSLRSFGNVPAPLSHTIFYLEQVFSFFRQFFRTMILVSFIRFFVPELVEFVLTLSSCRVFKKFFVGSFLVGVGSRRCKLIVLSIPSDRSPGSVQGFFLQLLMVAWSSLGSRSEDMLRPSFPFPSSLFPPPEPPHPLPSQRNEGWHRQQPRQ